jgi:nucleotide-binding universal stress UspA family protein
MKILVGYDGSAPSKEALNLARKHAKAFGAFVYVVTSLEADTGADRIRHCEDELEYTKQFLSESGITVETHLLIRGMSPGEDIVTFALDHEVDEIVVGLKKVSAVEKMIFGSNARYVILHAQCPVVSVK